MRSPRHGRNIPVLMVGIGACGGDASTTDNVAVQIQDSAGVRMVTYEGSPTAEPAFRLSAEPRYRHGTNPGDYAFRGINVGRLFPGGRAIVSDEWNSELVVLSAAGTTHEVLAREGEGPGEVGHVSALFALEPDSILATDLYLGRMTLFVGDSVARTTNLRLPSYVGVEGVGSRGELLLATRWGPSDFEEAWLPGHMVRFDLETGILDTVASYDFMPRIPPGLEWDPIRAVGEVTVATGHFVHVRSDRAEVTWRLSDGTVTQIVRWQAESVQLTEELLEPVDAKHLKSLRLHSPNLSDAQIAELAEEHMAVYHASVGRPLPLFGAAFADAEGRVWLPSYNAGGEFTAVPPYTVIAADGAWLGNVEAPPRFRILDVAYGLVLGVELDEMDVESVVVYELAGRRGQPQGTPHSGPKKAARASAASLATTRILVIGIVITGSMAL